MSNLNLQKRLNLLDARSKAVSPPQTKELQAIQLELDDISANFEHYKNHDEFRYFLYEIQARLHYVHGRLDEAERFCDEAIRLVGAEYPDANWLKRMISKQRLYDWDKSSNEALIRSLRKEKNQVDTYLVFAIIALFIFVPLTFAGRSAENDRSEMIDTCLSDISEAEETISSLNSSLDEISSRASNSIGNEYEDQESALDEISTSASDAQRDVPTSDCSQDEGDTYYSD